MKTARIMPAQHLEQITGSCTRYGFIISNHPNGCVGKEPHETYRDTGKVYNQGDYIASWATREIANTAAFVLGVSTDAVQPVSVFLPQGVQI